MPWIHICLHIYMFIRILRAVPIHPDAFFKLLADPTRLRCLLLLLEEGELCVCELTQPLGLAQPKISRHLARLRAAGVVLDRREGLWIYYRLHAGLPTWARNVLQTTAAGVRDQAPFTTDRQALKTMPDRPGVACCA